jgi:TIR domain-containing protein
MQGNVFVNYRRQTDSGIAGRIYDSLNLALPNASIFMDVDKLNPGDDFEDALEKTLAGCVVFLAIIGPQWATMVNQSGQRRLDDPDDFVRKELRTALNKRVRVIPVLVGGAAMPDAGVLPEDLRALTKHQAMEIRHERFRADVDALAQVIAATAPGARAWRWRRAAIAAVAAFGIVAVAGFLYVEPIPIIHGNSPVASSSRDPAWTAWLDRDAYQHEFDRQVKNEWYPSMIEAQFQDDVVKYRAVFEPFPSSTFAFYARHSINDEEFAAFDNQMTKDGLKRVFQQRIVVHARPFNQGVWTKF